MSMRVEFLHKRVCNDIQFISKHYPLAMEKEVVFSCSRDDYIKELKRMIVLAEELDFDYFKPFIK